MRLYAFGGPPVCPITKSEPSHYAPPEPDRLSETGRGRTGKVIEIHPGTALKVLISGRDFSIAGGGHVIRLQIILDAAAAGVVGSILARQPAPAQQ